MKPPTNMWKAVILVGGPEKGTRFRPLSLDVPKPLFPVAGFPMVEHHIEACSKVPEIREIFLIGFYQLTDDFRQFIENAKKKYNRNIQYIPEPSALGTAGGLHLYKHMILAGDPTAVFVFNSDVCCEFDLQNILTFHQEVTPSNGLTIVVTEATHEESLSYGCVVEDLASHEATHYVEKPETFVSSLINCGVYVFSPDVLMGLSDVYRQHYDSNDGEKSSNVGKISLEQDILKPFSTSGKMFVYKTNKPWGQIKSAASAIHANKLYLSQYHTTHPDRLAANSRNGGPKIIGDVFVHESATVHSSAVLGPNVTIGNGVVIGAGVRVCNSIVLPGAELKDRCCIRNSIIGWKSVVGEWSRVEGTAQQPDPNAPFAKIVSGCLFDNKGRLIPSITVLGRGVRVSSEIIILNSILLPDKEIKHSTKNEIIL